MGKKFEKEKIVQILLVVVVVLLGLFGYGFYRYYNLSKDFSETKTILIETQKTLVETKDEVSYLLDNLNKEQDKNKTFEDQIGQIANTVGTLDKLSKTDKELLQKYSKVYFLNENYVTNGLSDIPKEYLLQKERTLKIHSKVLPYLEEMIKAMRENQTPIEIVSAYRSFGEQSSLKNNYNVVYGAGANTFSADQGYSEHQLGTALDLTTENLGANFTDFGDTKAYQWLLENAYKYGFILSYPEGNDYYQFEPWHFRFVGKSLAKRLHEEKQFFYDLSQRNIDAYLINIFD